MISPEETIRAAVKKWPTTFVARKAVHLFTGGLISVGYLANLDSLGKGPPGAFKVGRHQAYPAEALAEWLISRIGRQ